MKFPAQLDYRALLATALAAATASVFAAAPAFPDKPVRFVVPFSPGSATDALARVLSPRLTEMWNEQVVVDNRAGAGSVVGTGIAAKSAPDGYTLLIVSASHAVNATLYKKLPFDPVKDFAGVTLVASVPNVLVVNPTLPVQSVKELIALAKARPGVLNCGSAGIGSASHLNLELFKSMAGLDIVHVPFKGFAEQLTELYANRLQLTFAPQVLVLSHIQAGRVRALGVSTAKRSSSLPNVPTVAEAAIPGFVFDPWFGVLVPAGTPREVVGKLNADIIKVLQLPDVRERLLAQGAEPVWSTPGEFDAYLKSEVAKLGRIVTDSGAKAE